MIMALAPGTRGYTKAIIAAQMLAQIGAFALPALLPDYIARWNLSKTEAGWLVGIFFAAYVVMVPVLVALTDRVPVRRVYMLGTTLTVLSHFGFALFADGFWSALLLRLLAGIGWAGTYMPGPTCRDSRRSPTRSRGRRSRARSPGMRPVSGSPEPPPSLLPAWLPVWPDPRRRFCSAARPP